MAEITRGKIIRDDLALYDGVTRTASRLDATGGTVTGLNFGDKVDVLQVFGSGISRSVTTIKDAIGRLGGANATLLFSTGTWTIDSNLTIPANAACYFPLGTIFDISSGITLTLNGHVNGGVYQIFSGSGIVAGFGKNVEVYPYWWGENTIPGTTDMSAAINNALSVSNRVVFPPETMVADNLTAANSVELVLQPGTTIKHKASSSNPLLTATGDFNITGGTIDGNKANITSRVNCLVSAGTDFVAEGVKFQNTIAAAIQISDVEGLCIVRDCEFTGMEEHSANAGENTVCLDINSTAAQYVLISGNRFVADTPSSPGYSAGGIIVSGVAASVRVSDNYFERIGQSRTSNFIGAVQLYTDAKDSIVANNVFVNSNYSAIVAQNCPNTTITGNVIDGFTGPNDILGQIVFQLARSEPNAVSYVTISNNVINLDGNTTEWGIIVSGDNAGVLSTEGVTISGNTVKGGDVACALAWFTNATITGNSFHSQSGTATSSGVRITDMSDDDAVLNITGNSFVDSGKRFIYIPTASNVDDLSVSIVGNSFYVVSGTPTNFVQIRSESGLNLERVVIDGNIGRGTCSVVDFDVRFADALICSNNNSSAATDSLDNTSVTLTREVGNSWQPLADYTTGAHTTLRDFTGTTTSQEALQLLETLTDDLISQGVLK